jgi:hypothetical protein
MKAMKVIGFVICGLGLIGSLSMLGTPGEETTGILGMVVYSFFLALTVTYRTK